MMYRALRNALLCAAVLAGCAREAAEEKEAGKTRKLSTAEVMAQVAKAVYQPPADGRLTEEQVRKYLEVKRRARQGRTAEPPAEDSEEPSAAADLRAALELGYNPKELSWVQERVLEAWIALRGQELDRKIAESRNQMIRDLETRLQSAADPKQKAELEKQIAEIRAAAPASARPIRSRRRSWRSRSRRSARRPRPPRRLHPWSTTRSWSAAMKPRWRGRSPTTAAPRRIGMQAENKGAGERWAVRLVCSRTGVTAPLDEPAFVSPAGAPWLVEYDLDPEKGERLRRALPGRPWTLWRYRELLPLSRFEDRVDLGEGGTPLIRLRRLAPPGIEVLMKDEAQNPTGSFKARGLSLAVNRARELGAPGVQLASAGNAALALTAYAAAAGLRARVALPSDTPRTVFERCREHGAEVLDAPGTLVEAAKLLEAGGENFWGVSTLREPYRAEGKKTMGLELAEQLGWELPDWIVYPLGGGTGIVGMHKAFDELRRLGLIGPKRPRFVIVQMTGCAPMVRAFERGEEAAAAWEAPDTRVWGLRVPKAIADFLVLRAVRESGGRALAIDEARLPEVTARFARTEGLRIGPEGAAAFAALDDLAAAGELKAGERVVVFQTGDPGNYL